tara:strand:+ start:200 stop:502 length:303 start_codon:yes stop_codon:yes gene_type:complete
MLCLGKKSSKAEITSQEKRNRDFMDGFHEEAESKRKAVKRREDGLLAEPVSKKVALSHAVGLMLPKEESVDVAPLAPLVKLTKGGRGRELERYSQKRQSS